MSTTHETGVPPSAEVRRADGVFIGPFEQAAAEIYKGDAGTLGKWIVQLELIDEKRRSDAVGQFAAILVGKMMGRGVVGIEELKDGLAEWHEASVMNEYQPVYKPPQSED